MGRSALLAVLAACAVAFLLMLRLSKLEQKIHGLEQRGLLAGAVRSGSGEPPLEVAVYMGRIQIYANKLWSAGKAGNLPLADFYRHEMKEAMEEVAKAGILDDGVDVSEKMSTYGIKTLDAMKAAFQADGLKDFDARFATLVEVCNTCHRECGKPYLRIKVPTYTRYDDQEFAPEAVK